MKAGITNLLLMEANAMDLRIRITSKLMIKTAIQLTILKNAIFVFKQSKIDVKLVSKEKLP